MTDQRVKGARLPKGAPRRMTDAKCAWCGMDKEQRAEFLLWLDEQYPLSVERLVERARLRKGGYEV